MPKLFHFLRPRHALPLLLLLGSFTALHAQQIAVKTNGLMFAAMMPNVGCEFVVGERSSIDISAFGAVNIYGNKAQMIGLMPEYRYWFNGRPMTREFVGISALGTSYDITWGRQHLSGRRSRRRSHLWLCTQLEQTPQRGVSWRIRCRIFQAKTILQKRQS